MQVINIFIATVVLGTLLTALTARSRKLSGAIGVLSVTIITAILLYVAYRVFTLGPRTLMHPLMSLPTIGAQLSISVDHLSAIFLVLIGLVSFFGTLYSYRYMDIYPHQSLVRFYPFLILFIAGMIGVVVVTDMFFFYVFWEFMTLTSYFLVVYEKEDQDILQAGLKYFVMTHVGTAAMLIGTILLQAEVGSFAFLRLRDAMAVMIVGSPIKLSVILALFLLGFGTKAGMFPVGTWLPDAHPAAPSGVSAMLSGVMIKMGIYGFLRLFFFLLPVSNQTFGFGVVIAAFGTISLFMGTISALVQHDSKRLLAFHSIGQIGYILLGLGTGLAFLKINPVLSAIATMAAIYHVINHSMFKSLLFLNAGSIFYKTGTRDLNRLGGLYSVMPATAWMTLVASFSIAGIPPFNGFISKWLIYQTTIIGGIKLPVFIFFGLVAIFISSVTLASFLKFFSTSFGGSLGKKLASQLRPGIDVPFSMRLSQYALALFCLLLGLFPWVPLRLMYPVFGESLFGTTLPPLQQIFGNSRFGLVPVLGGGESGAWFPVTGFLVLTGCLLVALIISRLGRAGSRTVPVWSCGEVYETDEIRYRAGSFYIPLVAYFERLVYPELATHKIQRPGRAYKGLDFDKVFYYPFVDFLLLFSQKFRRTHVGIPQAYLLYQVIGIAALVAIMIWLS
ncbi:MAG: proton-conducting transporter membrane subunit [Proteobacteria bacterium]|nr:proton-conducting transporter membrane subunit [Pseudomonadota bacterium]